MPAAKKPAPRSRLFAVQSAWGNLSAMKKTLVSLGSVAAALIAISGAWGVGENLVEHHRPWAARSVEIVVAGLQLQSDQFTLKQIDDRMFQIRYELSRNPASQFLKDELKRTQDQRDKLQRRIDEQILKSR